MGYKNLTNPVYLDFSDTHEDAPRCFGCITEDKYHRITKLNGSEYMVFDDDEGHDGYNYTYICSRCGSKYNKMKHYDNKEWIPGS